MRDLTTSVRETVRVKQIREHIDRMLSIKPDAKCVALTQRSYDEYRAAIRDINHIGNPYYKGVEIKRIGDK